MGGGSILKGDTTILVMYTPNKKVSNCVRQTKQNKTKQTNKTKTKTELQRERDESNYPSWRLQHYCIRNGQI